MDVPHMIVEKFDWGEYLRSIDYNPVIMKRLGWQKAFKLFETRRGKPKSLVHGFKNPNDSRKRTRIYELGTCYKAETNTPGFNFFDTVYEASKYQKRFTVRQYKLLLCSVLVANTTKKTSNHEVGLAQLLIIPEKSWQLRLQKLDMSEGAPKVLEQLRKARGVNAPLLTPTQANYGKYSTLNS